MQKMENAETICDEIAPKRTFEENDYPKKLM